MEKVTIVQRLKDNIFNMSKVLNLLFSLFYFLLFSLNKALQNLSKLCL